MPIVQLYYANKAIGYTRNIGDNLNYTKNWNNYAKFYKVPPIVMSL